MIFLDEPTTGLDPRSRQMLWDVVGGLARSGVTIFLTTQYLEEADRVAVLDRGTVVADDTPARLKGRFAQRRLDLTATDHSAYAAIDALLGTRVLTRDDAGHTVGVATDGTAAHVRHLLDEIDPERRTVRTFAVHTATLDDVFLALTGHGVGADRERHHG